MIAPLLPELLHNRFYEINASLSSVFNHDLKTNVISVAIPYLQPWMTNSHISGIIRGFSSVQEGVEIELFQTQGDYTSDEALPWIQVSEGEQRNTLLDEGEYLSDWMTSDQVHHLFSFQGWDELESQRNPQIISLIPDLYEGIPLNEINALLNNIIH